MDRADVLIVGGGLAGAAAAESYRKAGGTGSVTIVSEDESPPVHRPPLSKGYLGGKESLDSVFVHPAEYYGRHGIGLRLGRRVERLDLGEKQVSLAGGEQVGFGSLVLATGARPRRLAVPGADRAGVHYLRSLGSAQRLITAAEGARSAVIIGAGFIGMEVAATLTGRGIKCTVVEMAPRMWSRLTPAPTADGIQRHFEQQGVHFRFGTGIAELRGDEHVRSVVLVDGEAIEADLVVAGVGVALNIDLASEAGLAVDNGVVVDAYLRASHPDVYAIGDIAAFPDPIAGRTHLEHWDNAIFQGRAVGATLAGTPTRFEHVAYFFSDLFDLSLNMIGYPLGWDDIVLRGDPESASFTTVYLRGGTLRAALMVNDDRYFDSWTSLVREEASFTGWTHALADPEVDPSALPRVPATVGA